MLFEAGRVAYAAGRFEDALDYFQRAHSMSGRAILLYNVGSAADKLRRDAVALDAFRRYLEAVPAAENRAEVESRIHVLEQVVAAAQLTVTATTVAATPGSGDTTATVTPPLGSETAHEAALDASLRVGGAGGDTPRDSGRSIFKEWWFWTVVGAVVVGTTTGIVVAASSGRGLGPFVNGTDGGVHMTLGAQ